MNSQDQEVVVDVIIPVYRPGRSLKELLRRLLAQTVTVHRIIIMNTEEQYWDEEEYRPLFENKKTELLVSHIKKADFDHGRTRRQGMLLSNAPVCICMTQDAVPADRQLIEQLVNALFSDEQVAVSYARQLPGADCRMIERYTRSFNYPEESRVKTQLDLEELGIKTYFCSNVCAAYKRELYLELGGFIQHTIFNEDMIFAAGAVKKGYGIAYAAEARVIHSHNYSCMEQLHRNFDLAVSQADHPEVFSDISSEGEGLRLVMKTAKYLSGRRMWYLLPELIITSGFKFLGFKLGKNYQILPEWLIKKLTMNQSYWE